MDSNLMIAVALILGGSFGARIINEKALVHLDIQYKSMLIDQFTQARLMGYLFLIVLLFAFLYFIQDHSNSSCLYFLLFMLIITAYAVISSVWYYNKFNYLGFPKSYSMKYLGSSVLRLLSLGLGIAFLLPDLNCF